MMILSILKKLICICLIVTLAMMSTLSYAAGLITTHAKFETTIMPPLDLKETIADEDIDLNDEIYDEAISTVSELDIYNQSILEAIASSTDPTVINLPTLFHQPTDHPYPDDHFGPYKEASPIFKVDLSKETDPERQNLIALTFDSAYINKYTYKILDILDEYNIKATFFMTYEFIYSNPAQVMAIIKRGHEIGNHSKTHPDFNKISDANVVAQVWKVHNYMRNLVGVDLCLFRFPFGSYSPRTVNLLKNLGYYPIQWTFDSVDWRNDGVDFLKKRFTNTEFLVPGAIILFHNGADYTPQALPYILNLIEIRGLKCVRVSDLIYKHGFHLEDGVQILND